MTCRKCRKETGGVEIAPGRVFALCRTCLWELQDELGKETAGLCDIDRILNDLKASEEDSGRLITLLLVQWSNMGGADEFALRQTGRGPFGGRKQG